MSIVRHTYAHDLRLSYLLHLYSCREFRDFVKHVQTRFFFLRYFHIFPVIWQWARVTFVTINYNNIMMQLASYVYLWVHAGLKFFDVRGDVGFRQYVYKIYIYTFTTRRRLYHYNNILSYYVYCWSVVFIIYSIVNDRSSLKSIQRETSPLQRTIRLFGVLHIIIN